MEFDTIFGIFDHIVEGNTVLVHVVDIPYGRGWQSLRSAKEATDDGTLHIRPSKDAEVDR